jgi:CHAT domain-containing protein
VLKRVVSSNARVANYTEQPFFELNYIDYLCRAGRYQEALDRVTVLRGDLDRNGRTDLGVVARLFESRCRRHLGEAPEAVGALELALDSLEVARTDAGHADLREAFGVHVMGSVVEGCRAVLEYPPDAPWRDRVLKFYDSLQRFKTRTLLERIKDPRHDSQIETALARPIMASHLQNDVLRRGELLLDIVVGEDNGYMFAVTADSCRLVTLPGWKAHLRRQIGVYADLLAEPLDATRESYPPERLAATQQALGRAILEPVADLIASCDRVIVAPDGFYSRLPFGTLSLNDHLLMESKDVVEVPSASVLEWAREDTVAATHIAASMLAVEGGSAAGLAGAQHEVASLRRRYANVTLVTAAPGVLDTLAQRAQPNCILHVAAHARVSDDSPWQSGFLLDPGTSSEGADSVSEDAPRGETVLRAWEIARSHLPYDMAVLAGCETAGGRTTGGEGVLGLTSAFLSAGVPVVVSSRWAIDDRVTAVLMAKFYDRLAAGENVGSALRAAQLAVRSNHRTSHPFYWAGFVVVGDGSRVMPPLVAGHRRTAWPAALAGASLAIVLALVAVRRRRPVAPA